MLSTLEQKKIRMGFGGIFIFFLLVLYLIGYTSVTGKILYILTLLCSLLLIYRAFRQKNKILFLVFIWFFIYIRVWHYAFFENIPISMHFSFAENKYLYDFGLIHFFFITILSIYIVIPSQKDTHDLRIENNGVLFIINYTIAFILFLIGKQGETIFSSGGYGQGEVQASSLNEYFIIFWFVSFFFSGKSKVKKNMLLGLSILYCLKNLMFGGRIETAMMGLGLIYLIYQYKVSIRVFLLFFILGTYIFGILGSIRQNPLLLIEGEWEQLFIPSWSGSEQTIDIISNQEGDVFQSSSRMVGMVTEEVLPYSDRIASSFYFLASVALPYSVLPDIAMLASYKSDIYPSGGGGLISAYFYVFGSWIGVFSIALFIARILSKVGLKEKNRFIQIYIFFLITTLPRWFAYNPISIFKLSLYGVFITLFFYGCHCTWKKYIVKPKLNF